MKKLLLALLLFTCLATAWASDEVYCAIEDLACEVEVDAEEVFNFLRIKSLKPEEIQYPDLYVKTFAWLNTPYRYGGNSRSGIDCSRFAYMLQGENIGLGQSASSADMFKAGHAVEKHELCEGDLVFFRIKQGRISHVGVYLQDGKFAHSSTSKGVIISDLEEPYWKRYFYKGARYPSAQ
jgi:murein DD-endopeptidase / murein LD-carboxypeptidase